ALGAPVTGAKDEGGKTPFLPDVKPQPNNGFLAPGQKKNAKTGVYSTTKKSRILNHPHHNKHHHINAQKTKKNPHARLLRQ
ncbi:hypothetical protein QN399_26590, partial [Pseudomonas sp. 10C3]|uniref:hypothetical protein n=1 Tax=Pseudomonas sp. 10C3 TaxID=3118753 RepID=UPI002E7FF18B